MIYSLNWTCKRIRHKWLYDFLDWKYWLVESWVEFESTNNIDAKYHEGKRWRMKMPLFDIKNTYASMCSFDFVIIFCNLVTWWICQFKPVKSFCWLPFCMVILLGKVAGGNHISPIEIFPRAMWGMFISLSLEACHLFGLI